ncbi:MAG: PQQ-binding-like beta-propeller repeat protein [Planctomycetes bacterium]|nr:PQQ-binding-like beta-propeller repeat protein [Planctomycetota bacterium]
MRAALCTLFLLLGATSFAQDEVHPFSIPNTRGASDLSVLAQEHLTAQRWDEAISVLQRIIDQHGGALLGPSRPTATLATGTEHSLPSQQDVYPGATEWARLQLAALPPEALELYESRYVGRATSTLEQAREDFDQAALAELAERWPQTGAAPLAWWSLGDLEFEAGHIDAARFAWARALRRELQAPDLHLASSEDWFDALAQRNAALGEAAPGVTRRVEIAAATYDPLSPWAFASGGRDARTSELRISGPGEGAPLLPGADASSWPRSFPMPPQPFQFQADMLWHAVSADDLVLFSTSRRLVAVNMWSGREQWSSTEAAGWERMGERDRKEYELGLDKRDALFAPAVADGIVVAPLQVPYSEYRNEDYDNIPILRIIPERRLFAWDVQTGEELWNHDIPDFWDGESGSFAQRMRVAGPPVIAASRVLVPVYRLEGRIGFHVACYDLTSGRLLWSQQVISGQRELNMFSRPGWAFSAPPVRVEGDRVICLTQLGTLASLDLFTGALQWETLYEQLPLPRRRSFDADRRPATWRNTPPVVADGVVLATPVDSDDLIAVDVETGSMLWSLRQSKISRDAEGFPPDVDLLLGADDETVYLGGRRLIALERAGGLRLGVPRRRWSFGEAKIRDEDSRAWPVLAADRIVVPTTTARLEIERKQGRLLSDTPWTAGQGGNLLAVDGALFTLNSRHLSGYFEWDVLLERARRDHRGAPQARDTVRNLAALLAERGRNDQRAGYTESARSWLAESVDLLTEFRANQTAEADAELLAELHNALRSYAEVQSDLADTRGALRSLETARVISPDRRALRDTLLQEVSLLRKRDDVAWLEALGRLEQQCGDFQLRCAVQTSGAEEFPVRLVPLDPREQAFERDERTVPVGLWASLERADYFATTFDVQSELEELHHQLYMWPDEETPWGTVREMAEALIAERLSVHGRGVYAPYDEAARQRYDEALAAGDRAALEAVPLLYPFAAASEEANDALLKLALEEGDPTAVARTVLSELPEEWNPARATAREAILALHLGVALAREGNESYLRGLLGRLASSVPRAVSPFPEHEGRTISEVYASLGPEPRPTPAPEPTFGSDLRAKARVQGDHEYLGELLPSPGTPPTKRLLFSRYHDGRSSLLALDAQQPEKPLWEKLEEQSRGNRVSLVAFVPGRALIATRETLRAFDADNGDVQWTWRPNAGDIRSVRAARGLAIVVASLPAGARQLFAVDVTTGRTVWKRALATGLYHAEPLVGEDELVFLPNVARRRGLVVDLYTGAKRMDLQFPIVLQNDAFRAAWIEDGLLIVPWFHESRDPDRNQVVAVDLDSGRQAWRVALEDVAGGGRELNRVLRWAGRTFLSLLDTHAPPEGRAPGILVELHTNLGATAELSGYRFDERFWELGGSDPRLELESPYWFQLSPAPGDLFLHAVHLPFGHERWASRLQLSDEGLYNGMVPVPVLSKDTVAAIVVVRKDGRGADWQSMLYLFGRDDGTPRGNQILGPFDRAGGALGLYGLGDALVVIGDGGLKVMR